MTSSDNRAILVTAATKRIGLHLSIQSLLMGYRLIAHYRSDKEPLERWLDDNPRYREKTFFLRQDLTHEPAQLIHRCATLPVTLWGLVNNASLFTQGNLSDPTHLSNQLSQNTIIPLKLAAAFATVVKEGWIVNMTDANITTLNTHYQNYRISKLLLTELTRQEAFLWAPALRVNAIAPGAMLPPQDSSSEYFASLTEKIPLRKTGDIPSLLEAYRMLVENGCLTGQILYIDNGVHIAGY